MGMCKKYEIICEIKRDMIVKIAYHIWNKVDVSRTLKNGSE